MSDRTEKADVASLNGPPSFSFISSEDLRESLESDYVELTKAISTNMWKSACILAGSIAEAVLMDYIVVTGKCKAGVEDLAAPGIGLQNLIDAAIGIDVLAGEQPPDAGWEFAQLASKGTAARKSRESSSLRTAYAMSSAVADFRNLIHPGRELRLKEHVDESLALAARAFTLRLCSDLSKESAMRYPYKAEDILDKAQRDASARTILETMLRETRPAEVDRLLTDVCPRAFLADYHRPVDLLAAINSTPDNFDGEDVENYEPIYEAAELSRKADAVVYRIAFDWGTAAQKRAGLHTIAHLLTTSELGAVVKAETELLQMTDLKYASDEDRKLIIGDVLDRICGKNAEQVLLASASGIGAWIAPERASEFAKALLDKSFQPGIEEITRQAAFWLLETEYKNMVPEAQSTVCSTAIKYREYMINHSQCEGDVNTIGNLINDWEVGDVL